MSLVSGMGRRDDEQRTSFCSEALETSEQVCTQRGADTKEASFIGMAEKLTKHGIYTQF